mmetsp:Transcript_3437/g.5378  ORF Transcript_3437/g.5378 Transcript_3437/m.5378 type:complete len:242 (-) Transcript_3437:312-1037(-)
MSPHKLNQKVTHLLSRICAIPPQGLFRLFSSSTETRLQLMWQPPLIPFRQCLMPILPLNLRRNNPQDNARPVWLLFIFPRPHSRRHATPHTALLHATTPSFKERHHEFPHNPIHAPIQQIRASRILHQISTGPHISSQIRHTILRRGNVIRILRQLQQPLLQTIKSIGCILFTDQGRLPPIQPIHTSIELHQRPNHISSFLETLGTEHGRSSRHQPTTTCLIALFEHCPYHGHLTLGFIHQ